MRKVGITKVEAAPGGGSDIAAPVQRRKKSWRPRAPFQTRSATLGTTMPSPRRAAAIVSNSPARADLSISA